MADAFIKELACAPVGAVLLLKKAGDALHGPDALDRLVVAWNRERLHLDMARAEVHREE